MTLRVDTDRLRQILSASLPSGVRAAELFVESRAGVTIRIRTPARGAPGPGRPRVERSWEAGAHLRRFSEGRRESFILDAPTAGALEALALHPEALSVEWLGSAPLALPPGPGGRPAGAGGRTPADALMPATAGAWSDAFVRSAVALLEGWLDRIARHAPVAAGVASGEVVLEAAVTAQAQEVLVLATGADPARDTRPFVEATLSARAVRDDGHRPATQTHGGATLEEIERRSDAITGALLDRIAGVEAAPPPQGEMPVVFASPSGGFLLHEICGHLLEADHVLRGASPFTGARGRAIASPQLTMADDGSIGGMRGSSLFDDEGIAARRTPLIMEGTLVGYLSDRATAHATGGISTGNGRRQSYRDSPMPRMTNLVIDPGAISFDEIVASTHGGLLVKRLGRGRVDPSTGRFALAVEEGYLVENGRVGPPVAGAVLRGTAGDLLHAIDAVGDDATADTGSPLCVKDDQALPFGILQPTLRVRAMTVSDR